MQNDPLAPYRKKPRPPEDDAVPKEPQQYLAFDTKDKVFRLRIRSVHEPVHSVNYHLLLNVVYDGEHGTHFMLVYTVLLVLVRGKNLQRAIFAIENGMADYIQEYDPARWPMPPDEAAFIESIEIQPLNTQASDAETVH